MIGYMNSTITLESSKVVLDLQDPDFITIRFYQGSRCIAHVHVSPRDNKSLKLTDRDLQFGNEYTLMMEEVNASDTAESA